MVTRRRLLTTGTAVLSVTITGCIGVLEDDEEDEENNGTDSSNQDGTVNGNESTNGDDADGDENGEENGTDGTPNGSYTDWLAADIVGDYWSVITLTPARVAEIEGVEDLGFADDLEGIAESDIGRVIIFSEAGLSDNGETLVVTVGRFDSQTILEAFRESQVEGELVEDGTYHEYDLYSDTGAANIAVFGLRNGIAALATSRETFELGIDARRGDASRLHETDERFRNLDSTLSVSDRVSFNAQDSFGGAAIANGYDYAPEESTFELVVHHTSSEAASSLADDIETELTDLDLIDPTVSVSGDIVRVSAGEPTDRIDTDSPGQSLVGAVMGELGVGIEDPSEIPQVSFSTDYDPEADVLRITHTSGDMFTAGQLRIEGRGSPDAGATWAELSTEDDVTATTQIGAGSTASLQSTHADYDLALVWTSADGEAIRTLATFQGPEA